MNSSRLFMRELNRLGVTSVIDAGGGTDATRVSGYNPWITLYWLTAGKTIGGTTL
jgi:predicted amidohydrolase YtcJ